MERWELVVWLALSAVAIMVAMALIVQAMQAL